MNEQEMKQTMAINVDITTKDLTDLELAELNNVVQLDMDPHGRIFDYDKVEALFTINGVRTHEETKAALAMVVNRRLAK